MKRLRLHTVILLCFLLLIPSFVFPEHVHAETYGVCQICHGSAKCGLCDPAKVPEGLGNGYLRCHYCDDSGMRRCGTNTTGDGQRIGCDGSGYKEDGSVCEVCGGAGKYLCDACGGGKQFECRCRMNGYPGKCDVCYGTGWRTVDSQGQGINTAPVYPPDGATIDFGVNGKHERYTYNASRFGSGVTPSQAMAKAGASSLNEFQQALRGAAVSGGSSDGSGSSGSSGSGSGSSGGSNSSGGQNDQQGGQDPQPGPDPGPDGNGSDNPYDPVEVTDEELAQQLSSGDDIYLFRGVVNGGSSMAVRIVRSALDPGARARVDALSESDIKQLRSQLEAAVSGFSFGLTEAFDQVCVDDERSLFFSVRNAVDLPCICDIVIQIPEIDFPAPHHVYRVDGAEVCEVGTPPDFDVFDGVRYLVASSERLSAFAFTDTEPVFVEGIEETDTYDQKLQSLIAEREKMQSDVSSGSVQNAVPRPGSDPAPAPQPASQNNTVLLAVIAALAAVIVILLIMLIRKKR